MKASEIQGVKLYSLGEATVPPALPAPAHTLLAGFRFSALALRQLLPIATATSQRLSRCVRDHHTQLKLFPRNNEKEHLGNKSFYTNCYKKFSMCKNFQKCVNRERLASN